MVCLYSTIKMMHGPINLIYYIKFYKMLKFPLFPEGHYENWQWYFSSCIYLIKSSGMFVLFGGLAGLDSRLACTVDIYSTMNIQKQTNRENCRKTRRKVNKWIEEKNEAGYVQAYFKDEPKQNNEVFFNIKLRGKYSAGEIS